MIAGVDRNGDGRVDFEEFKELMTDLLWYMIGPIGCQNHHTQKGANGITKSMDHRVSIQGVS
jgi:hypothetical protein